jgi:hypothetical protein
MFKLSAFMVLNFIAAERLGVRQVFPDGITGGLQPLFSFSNHSSDDLASAPRIFLPLG